VHLLPVQVENPGRALLGLQRPPHCALALEQSQDLEGDVAVRAEDGARPSPAGQIERPKIRPNNEVLAQLDLDAEGGRQRLHGFDAADVRAGKHPYGTQRRQLFRKDGRLPAAPTRERSLEVIAPPLARVAGVGVPDEKNGRFRLGGLAAREVGADEAHDREHGKDDRVLRVATAPRRREELNSADVIEHGEDRKDDGSDDKRHR
jgi:hypothetical protein